MLKTGDNFMKIGLLFFCEIITSIMNEPTNTRLQYLMAEVTNTVHQSQTTASNNSRNIASSHTVQYANQSHV